MQIMPTDLIHRIGIATPAKKIYRPLTAEQGIRAGRQGATSL
jgi:hypothetical protein